ncbi:MAG: hypothetical protein H0T61_05750 [Actinobacteria bacterium]|nr:hypothetical protein [Actinomycetota bacterium]
MTIPSTSDRPLRILFFMRAINYGRLFECLLESLLDRGHRIHIALDVEKKGRAGDTTLFDGLAARFPDFSYGPVPERRDKAWEAFARELRLGVDYLRYFDRRFADAPALRRRARERVSPFLRQLGDGPVVASERGRGTLDRLLRFTDRSVPVDSNLAALFDDFSPELVLVTPLVGLGSPQGDYVRAARQRGVPTSLLVASWDNLTNKGVVRDPPDLTVVWNEAQRRECVELHGLDAETVCVAGAHSYDHWFDWAPSTTREEFCRKVGLGPTHPYVLYVCSSGFIAPQEHLFVRRWLDVLRNSGHETLRTACVIVRPHPANFKIWSATSLAEPGETAVWPPEGASPTSVAAKNDYYDSIYHAAAVIGVNTSALVEASILGKPVLTLIAPEFHETQGGTLHFAYLATENGGVLQVARSFDEHHAQIVAALDDEATARRRAEGFVRTFLRPRGMEAASPKVVEALERLATEPVATSGAQGGEAVARAILSPLVHGRQELARRRPGRRRPRPTNRHVPTRLRILIFLDHPGALLHFDETIRSLTRNGHRVHVAFTRSEKYAEAIETVDAADWGIVVHGDAPVRDDRYAAAARAIRSAADYIHYLDPSLARSGYARAKWRTLAQLPSPLRRLEAHETLPRPRVRQLLRTLKLLENGLPSDPTIERFIRGVDPHVVVVSPLIDKNRNQTDYIKSARALGIPTALCVTSWDHLTMKGFIRIDPDRVIVWNETQRTEAIEHHNVDPRRIALTGAQQFDRWFNRSPSSSREDLLARFGLQDGAAFLLFVGSTRQNQPFAAEPEFTREWLRNIRRSDDPTLRDAAVLIRPHPSALERFDEADFSEFGNVAVWLREHAVPIGASDRSEYFDALFHADALVGINSTAMIEATIVGRPVHTICLPEFRAMQHDLIHYHYLRQPNGGFLREAASFDEHTRLLSADLHAPEERRAERLDFVATFVRPQGLEVSATARLIEAIEQTAMLEPPSGSLSPLVAYPVRAAAVGYGAYGGLRIRGFHGASDMAGAVSYVSRGIARRLLDSDRSVRGAVPIAVRALSEVGSRSDRARRRYRRTLRHLEPEPREPLDGSTNGAATGPLKLVFCMRHASYVRNFAAVIEELAERGHRVHVAFDRDARWLTDAHPLEPLCARYPALTYGPAPKRKKRRIKKVESILRKSLDYLRFLGPEFDSSPALRSRVAANAPRRVRAFEPLLRRERPRAIVGQGMGLAERAIPPHPALRRFVAEQRPDALLVTPLLLLGSDQRDYVRAASSLGIPTVVCVASWDNLTTKSLMRVRPSLVTVWNEQQRQEAIELHGVPSARIAVTGAHSYDHWFDWQPSTSREVFCREIALDPDEPIVLYLCSSKFIAPDEAAFVLRWLDRLRDHGGTLARAGVIVRPHPQNAEQWQDVDLSTREQVAVWPRAGADPIQASSKNDFYDSLHHSHVVVGINTSALIESAIVGRPVLTVLAPEFSATQEGTLHFGHLAHGDARLLVVASTLDEHLEQLAAELSEGSAKGDFGPNEAFLRRFVRPHGLARPAAPILADAIERAARGLSLEPQAVSPRVRGDVTEERDAGASVQQVDRRPRNRGVSVKDS